MTILLAIKVIFRAHNDLEGKFPRSLIFQQCAIVNLPRNVIFLMLSSGTHPILYVAKINDLPLIFVIAVQNVFYNLYLVFRVQIIKGRPLNV